MELTHRSRSQRRNSVLAEESEQMIAVRDLVREANDIGDIESQKIYKSILVELEKKKNRRELLPSRLKLGAAGLAFLGLYGTFAYSLDTKHATMEDVVLNKIPPAVEDDGFVFVNAEKPRDPGIGLEPEYNTITLEPVKNCTLTTIRTNHDLNSKNPDIETYTFSTEDDEITVQSAEEVVERYGPELCQLSE